MDADKGKEILIRNITNLSEGMKIATDLVNAMKDYNGPRTQTATIALFDLIRGLDSEDAREQLTTVVQYRDQLREERRDRLDRVARGL